MKKQEKTGVRTYVLDTNVLMHEPTSLFRFEEHNVFIPLDVLEELDNNKKGPTEIARNSRSASRILEAIFANENSDMGKGVSLAKVSGGIASGNLFIQIRSTTEDHSLAEPEGKADNRIISLVQKLTKKDIEHKVILVSKDINMRIKARALGISAEDYQNDKVIEDSDVLYTGTYKIPPNFWEAQSKNLESWQEGSATFYKVSGPIAKELLHNEFAYSLEGKPFHARVIEKAADSVILRTINDYANEKKSIYGISALNKEQNYALNLLLDPEIDLVTLVGKAGSGKTLLALAAGLQQTIEKTPLFSEIIMTRVTIPAGEDIGFLPGTEEEKMNPWMGALDDNLDVLHKDDNNEGGDKGSQAWQRAATRDLLRTRIRVKSLNFMRGRTFLNKFVIIDEVQNLTPKQIKMLITRAGPGTKIVCLGNLEQIDTPYLTEGSSGLTYLVDRFKGWEHYGHVILNSGERSRLASHANEVLK